MTKDPFAPACYRDRYCGVVDGSTPCCEYLWSNQEQTRSGHFFHDLSLHDDDRAIKKRIKER
ncbi:hypothetical protein BDR06DRAFT_959189 [Suillus hirtellus]|nr:hypothetical protein BDR06DRAFT_959189 [Suillus hirtellus]